jgi:hypothetical protein
MTKIQFIYASIGRPFLIWCLVASSSWGISLLNINLHQQIKDSLCWAGVSQSVLEYYGVTKSQSDIRAYATNGSNVTVPLFDSHNQNRKGIDSILSHLGNITSTGVWDTITLDAVKGQINFDRPVIALLEYFDGFYYYWYPIGHFVTIIGYNNTSIEYLDPKYGTWGQGDKVEQYNNPSLTGFVLDTTYDHYYDQNSKEPRP